MNPVTFAQVCCLFICSLITCHYVESLSISILHKSARGYRYADTNREGMFLLFTIEPLSFSFFKKILFIFCIPTCSVC